MKEFVQIVDDSVPGWRLSRLLADDGGNTSRTKLMVWRLRLEIDGTEGKITKVSVAQGSASDSLLFQDGKYGESAGEWSEGSQGQESSGFAQSSELSNDSSSLQSNDVSASRSTALDREGGSDAGSADANELTMLFPIRIPVNKNPYLLELAKNEIKISDLIVDKKKHKSIGDQDRHYFSEVRCISWWLGD